MPLYESVYIARQDISAQQVEVITESLSELVKENGGEVGRTEYWGLRSLAYRIKKNRKGHYVLLNINAPQDVVEELERIMRINEDVLRFLTIKVEELEETPSIMMHPKTSRPSRGRGQRGDRDEREEYRDDDVMPRLNHDRVAKETEMGDR